MKVIEIQGSQGFVDASGVRRTVDLSLLSGVQPGDYVVVHAGFAISKTDEEEAQRTLALFREMAELTEAEVKGGTKGRK